MVGFEGGAPQYFEGVSLDSLPRTFVVSGLFGPVGRSGRGVGELKDSSESRSESGVGGRWRGGISLSFEDKYGDSIAKILIDQVT